MICYFCHKELQIKDRVGRKESCPFCKNDLHICKNCEFYDSTAYNECREPQADRVVDKEKSNFCDYFAIGRGGPLWPPAKGQPRGVAPTDSVAEAKKKLEQLFKK